MRLDWLLPNVSGIPVLMYHRVHRTISDGLTVTNEQLKGQWEYLKNEGYTCLSLPQFLAIARGEQKAPHKAFLLTFDDGYSSILAIAYNLLKKYNWSATIFLIGDTLDGTAPIRDEMDRALTLEELRSLDSSVIQLAMHGYHHENFSKIPLVEAKAAIEDMIDVFDKSGIAYYKALAYPYGTRPKSRGDSTLLKALLDDAGIEAAFRIGNKPETVPSTDIYEIKRIDIRGEDTLEDFKIKLKKGKLKPF